MRIQQLDINKIIFETKEYTPSMKESIIRIGLSFPIKVSLEDNKYYCQDGHKRLSAIRDMQGEEIYQKRRLINVIIINNGNSRSNDCWRARNMH